MEMLLQQMLIVKSSQYPLQVNLRNKDIFQELDTCLSEEWLYVLDNKFHQEGWKVAIIIDNCPAHPPVVNYDCCFPVKKIPPSSLS